MRQTDLRPHGELGLVVVERGTWGIEGLLLEKLHLHLETRNAVWATWAPVVHTDVASALVPVM